MITLQIVNKMYICNIIILLILHIIVINVLNLV